MKTHLKDGGYIAVPAVEPVMAAQDRVLYSALQNKVDKTRFIKLVMNGNPGTPMPPFKNNKRAMDNLDHIYAYLKARSDSASRGSNPLPPANT